MPDRSQHQGRDHRLRHGVHIGGLSEGAFTELQSGNLLSVAADHQVRNMRIGRAAESCYRVIDDLH